MQHELQPSLRALRWLTSPGPTVSPAVRSILMRELLSTPSAVLMGSFNSILIDICGIFIFFKIKFFLIALCQVALCSARLLTLHLAKSINKDYFFDQYILIAIIWCLFQGMTSFFYMQTGNSALQTLAAAQIVGIIGPICARNYPAPRLALLLLCACDLPFVAGACLSDQKWLLVLVPMTPPFIFGAMRIVTNYQTVAISALNGQQVGQQMARQDPLTKLPNRLAFTEALANITGSLGKRFVLLCIDLDGFKKVNDDLGHHGGDLMLFSVAERLIENIKPTDAVYRIGGDEFIIIAYDMKPHHATKFAERIIEVLTRAPHKVGSQMVTVGASVGFACAPEDGANGDDLHRMADGALYASKAAGRGVHRRYRLRLVADITDTHEPEYR